MNCNNQRKFAIDDRPIHDLWVANPIQGGGGPNQPPLSRICVYACEYAYMGANFL